MTSLILTDDSKQYQDLARDFSQNELAPRAESFDHSGQLPGDIWKKAWEIGLANIQIPEDLGGLGLSCLDATVVAEELGAGCAGISAAFWGTDLAVAPLLVAGTQEQQQRFIGQLMQDFALAGFAFGGKLTDRNGKISGEAYCINAHNAKWILARIDTADGAAGTVYAFDRKDEEIRIGEQMTRIGLKAADITTIYFNDVQVSKENMLGKTGDFRKICDLVDCRTAPLLAAYATGMARAAMEHAIKYSKERHTFGVPIANHQGVQFMLADMAKNVEAARLMTRKAAWLIDNGEPSGTASGAARTFALETAMQTATDAVQVYGGYGYSREYPVEKLMRDIKTMTALFTNLNHTRVEIGKELITSGR